MLTWMSRHQKPTIRFQLSASLSLSTLLSLQLSLVIIHILVHNLFPSFLGPTYFVFD